VATKYFQRGRALDPLNFLAWQMLAGVLPLTVLPLLLDLPPVQWSTGYALLVVHIGAISTAVGFLLWIAVLGFLPAGTASLNIFAIPVIALVSSMLVFGERLSASEWSGIACIGAGLAIVTFIAWRAGRLGQSAPPAPTPLDGG
jgi:O-acetylserine/cysteine efflux transporter